MKKITTFITLILLAIQYVSANPVTPDAARSKADAFFLQRGRHAVAKPARAPRMASAPDAHSAYYVFNAEQQRGFVIISGDDATADVLGYSDHGSFDETNLPVNVKSWLEDYARQIELISTGRAQAIDRRTVSTHANIAPLVQTQWDQTSPYNMMAPEKEYGRSVAGCVATAMAQIMNYHQWPATAPAIGSYDILDSGSNTVELTVEALPGTTFAWDKMLATYPYWNEEDNPLADPQVNAVATLMRYCGQAVKMKYDGPYDAATAHSTDVPQALINIFGYDSDIYYAVAENYSVAKWDEMIYAELHAGRPVYYSGSSESSGHAFVVDGYQADGQLYHVNWGWGGQCDGYYLLTLMNPTDLGTGGGSDTSGYRQDQAAVLGIMRPDGIDHSAERYIAPGLKGTNIWAGLSPDTFKDVMTFIYRSTSEVDADYEVVLASIGEDNTCTPVSDVNTQTYKVGYTYTTQWNLSLPNGTYKYTMLSRRPGSDTWLPMYNTGTYMELTVSNGWNNFTTHIAADEGLTATDFSTGGPVEKWQSCNVSFTIKNESANDFRGKIYLFLKQDNEQRKVSEQPFLTLEAGQSQVINTSFTMSYSGDGIILNVTTDDAGKVIIGSYTLPSVAEDADIQMVSGESSIHIDDQSISYNGYVTSYANQTYTRDIKAVIYKYTTNEEMGSKQVSVSVGQYAWEPVSFTFDGLDEETKYSLKFYFDKKGDGQWTEFCTYDFWTKVAAGTNSISQVDYRCTTHATSIDLYFWLLNNTANAYNDDIKVTVFDRETNAEIKSVTRTVAVPGNDYAEIPTITIDGLTPSTKYTVMFYFHKRAGSSDWTDFKTQNFKTDQSSGIDGIETDSDDATYYDLQGRKVELPLTKGIYILRTATDRRLGRPGRKVIIE